jgi:hypothetical protein
MGRITLEPGKRTILKSHAAQICEDLAMTGKPFFITQNVEASMVI